VQIVLLLAIMLIPIFFLERKGEKRFPWTFSSRAETKNVTKFDSPNTTTTPCASQTVQSYSKSGDSNVRKPGEVFMEFLRAFSLTTTLVYIVFSLTKLIGTGVNEIVTKTLYTQQLNPKWTDLEFSTASGLYAMGPIIVGAVLGGFLSDRFGRRNILIFGYGGYGLVALAFAANPGRWNEGWFAMSYILSYETLNAVASVGFLSMAMRISWTQSSAIVFTTYMTLSNVSHVAGNWLAGPVRRMLTFSQYGDSANMISYELTFWFIGLVTLAPLLLLIVVRPDEVDRVRQFAKLESAA